MSDPPFEDFVSADRFARYLSWAGGDPTRAVELYSLNSRVSEALYIPLQALEIALRNRIHQVASGMLTVTPDVFWFDRPEFQLGARQADQVAKAKRDLVEANKPVAPSRVVASLTFGYWTAFFSSDYEPLWRMGLHRIAQTDDGKSLGRKQFTRPLLPLRMLRNRVAHHEPIIDWSLDRHHSNVLSLLDWLSPAAAGWCRENSRFKRVYRAPQLRLP
jgi:hypothetical protein